MKWGTHFDVATLEAKADKLEELASAADFWSDAENAQKILREVKELRKKSESFRNLEESYEEALVLVELAEEDGSDSLLPDIKTAMAAFVSAYDNLRTATLLSGEYDNNNAILSLHAGAGGTEACDWAAMLLRMYTR